MGQSSSRSSSDSPVTVGDSRSPRNRAMSSSAADVEASQNQHGTEVQDAARSEPYFGRPVRLSRLSRARASFSNTIPLFRTTTQRTHTTLTPPTSGSLDWDLPPFDLPQLELAFDSSVINAWPPYSATVRQRSLSTTSLPERISYSRSDLGLRNMSTPLRRRTAAFPQSEDQAAMLPRLLSIMAAATAASLVGGSPRAAFAATRNLDAVPVDEEGTFDSFLRSLQNGQLTTAPRQSTSSGSSEGEADVGNLPPLNFVRIFRVGSQTNNGREPHEGIWRSSSDSTQSREEDEADTSSDGGYNNRMVPVVIVGIQSMGHEAGSNPAMGNPILDALPNFQPPATPRENNGTTHTLLDGFSQPPHSPNRFGYRRNSSMSGFSSFSGRRWSPEQTRTRSEAFPTAGTDSPPGSLPPPSTPIDAARSALLFGTTNPDRRTSLSSASHFATSSSRDDSPTLRSTPHSLQAAEEEPPHGSRSPRQSRIDDEAPQVESGNPRLNSRVERDAAGGEGSRGWIIYMLGGTYPENHPILTTSSLFTESPTYEDMLLLSSLLGPAKPPVATAEEVASAHGLLQIECVDGSLVAVSANGEQHVSIAVDERCLICLTAYESNEKVRQLVECNHVYHQECIGQWLTTGSNSCPLCRRQGVNKSGRNGTT